MKDAPIAKSVLVIGLFAHSAGYKVAMAIWKLGYSGATVTAAYISASLTAAGLGQKHTMDLVFVSQIKYLKKYIMIIFNSIVFFALFYLIINSNNIFWTVFTSIFRFEEKVIKTFILATLVGRS